MEKPSLDTQISDLENQVNKLHGDARIEQNIVKKEGIMAQRARLFPQLRGLKLKKHETEQAIYSEKLDALISENLELIFFSVNGTRIPIQEDLTVQITFEPCKHKLSFHIKEILRSANQSNKSLYERWNELVTTNISYTRSPFGMMCKECRKDKEKKFKVFRRKDDKPIGSLRWELRRLQ